MTLLRKTINIADRTDTRYCVCLLTLLATLCVPQNAASQAAVQSGDSATEIAPETEQARERELSAEEEPLAEREAVKQEREAAGMQNRTMFVPMAARASAIVIVAKMRPGTTADRVLEPFRSAIIQVAPVVRGSPALPVIRSI